MKLIAKIKPSNKFVSRGSGGFLLSDAREDAAEFCDREKLEGLLYRDDQLGLEILLSEGEFFEIVEV